MESLCQISVTHHFCKRLSLRDDFSSSSSYLAFDVRIFPHILPLGRRHIDKCIASD